MAQAEKYNKQVREQYEAYPYPERNPKDEKKRIVLPMLARLDTINHHCFGGRQDFKDFRVLVVGGGTGDTTIAWAEQLRGKKGSEVVYLDMSTASMDIARKRAKIRNLHNIKWINDSLLDLPALKEELGEFDFITCTGVLHHLDDPDAGLQAIKSVLKDDGAMEIMVYAKYGRMAVYQIQEMMQLINEGITDNATKIKNTRAVLKDLPSHHLFKVSQQLGHTYDDMNSDAGIYDLFLHSQDRPYTILEVHDWLERCDLKLLDEPGVKYTQIHYQPETFIKDEELLAYVKTLPLKRQQAIAENISSKITKHEFLTIPKEAKSPVADPDDLTLVPVSGMVVPLPFAAIAKDAEANTESFSVTFNEYPGKPVALIPDGKYIASILRNINGKNNIGDIIEAVQNDPAHKADKPKKNDILDEFKILLKTLNYNHMLLLRGAEIEPYPTIKIMQQRIQ
jgi:ubiquinone/menaquinone biosynthesis C-methylase UbiE